MIIHRAASAFILGPVFTPSASYKSELRISLRANGVVRTRAMNGVNVRIAMKVASSRSHRYDGSGLDFSTASTSTSCIVDGAGLGGGLADTGTITCSRF